MRVSHAKGWFLVLLIEQHCRDGTIHSEGNSELDPFEISQSDDPEFNQLDFLLYPLNRRRWSFAFTHASTSSKCILFAIRCLSQLDPSFGPFFWRPDWIVSEMIDWLKVCDPALIKEIFCNADVWEEPNSGSSTTGSADRLDGRCKREN